MTCLQQRGKTQRFPFLHQSTAKLGHLHHQALREEYGTRRIVEAGDVEVAFVKARLKRGTKGAFGERLIDGELEEKVRESARAE